MVLRSSFQRFLLGTLGLGLALTLMTPATAAFAASGEAPGVAVQEIGNQLSNHDEGMLDEYFASRSSQYQRDIMGNSLDALPSNMRQQLLEATLVEMGMLPAGTSTID